MSQNSADNESDYLPQPVGESQPMSPSQSASLSSQPDGMTDLSSTTDPGSTLHNIDENLHLCHSSERDQEEVHDKLRAYNHRYWKDIKDFSLHIERDGQIVAGIVAASTFETLEVEFLFVDEKWRGKGLGSLLLRTAEHNARQAGVRHVLLNTYNFQAPAFYPKMGYRRLFEINPCLGPYAQYFFWKDLD